MLVHRARRQSEDFADVAVGFALGDPGSTSDSRCGQREMLAQPSSSLRWSGGGQAEEIFVLADRAEEGELQRCLAAGSWTKPGSLAVAPTLRRGRPSRRRMRATTSSMPSSLPVAALTSRVACGVDQRIVPLPSHRQQMPAGRVERHAGALGRAGIGEMDADAGAQFVDVDRLGEIIDAAGPQRVDHMLGLGEAGHEDHRHLRHRAIRLQPAGRSRSHPCRASPRRAG